MTRWGIYARFSSDRQSETSIDDQVRRCRAEIDKRGGRLVETYADYAISGASARNRPALRALLEDAQAERIDAVIAEGLDRLSRDQEDVAGLWKRLRFAGVKLITLSEGDVDELHVGLRGTVNALYLRDLADKTRRGLEGRVLAGRSGGGRCYGYDVMDDLGPDGLRENGVRRINEDEAAIVRRIFAEYVVGTPPRAIAAALNTAGVPAPRGGAWNASTINGNRARRNGILHNELYVGRLVWNHQRFIKDPETGRRVARPNPPEQWITTELPELRIFDDATWSRAQALKAGLARHRPHDRRRARRLLSGLLVCGACGGPYTILGRARYGCARHREQGTCDNGRSISASRLEGRVLSGIKEHLLAPELVAEYVRTYHEELTRRRAGEGKERRRLQRRLGETRQRLERLVDQIADGTDTPTTRERLVALEAEREDIEAKLERLGEAPVIELHPGAAELYERRIEALQEALTAEESVQREASAILRSVIEKIVLHPGAARGEIEIELHGALAAIFQLGGQKKTSRAVSAGGMTLMVAGARNRLNLLFDAPGLGQ